MSEPNPPIAKLRPPSTGRVRVDGKQFALDGERFRFRGVTYGTFRPRAIDGARFPDRATVAADFSAMRANGFTVVRTYTMPPEDVVECAVEHGLHLLPGAFHPDLRYLLGSSRREVRRTIAAWHEDIRQAAEQLRGAPNVLALCLGNEIPADVVRWNGAERVAALIERLSDTARAADPDLLVTYANYPTAEYLPLDGLDFLTFNVYLERQRDFRKYLTRLQNLAGDRPLVLGELGQDASGTPDGEEAQAEVIGWQLETAVERGVAGTCVFSWTDEWWVGDAVVEGWSFGLTRADRSPKAALEVARRWNSRDVSDLEASWPSIAVVICAYNAEVTLDECLRHTCALDYPGLEVIVVDDGSTDLTATIARRHPRARLVQIDHAGLSVARNAGLAAATAELIAYLDSDAYPTPEWPYFLALGLDGRNVGGTGGPNLPPVDAPAGAQAVALAPGGPAHVLLTDDRAEHIPGCNMAFWRAVLEEIGGFDPVYTAAGDDVDVCWKVTDLGWDIAFHPAAVVWHHRRSGVRTYLRQQRGYGRAEALVAARHPDRFTNLGTARWRGRIYLPGAPSATRQKIYHGPFGSSAYQSVYAAPAHGIDMVHQLAVPVSVGALACLPLAAIRPTFAAIPLAATAILLGLFLVDVARTQAPRTAARGRLWFRSQVALLTLLQPAARMWGRVRSSTAARRDLPPPADLPGPATSAPGNVTVLPASAPRPEIARRVIDVLAAGGLRVLPGSGWEPRDATVLGSSLVKAELLTSAWPEGAVQVRLRWQLRRTALVLAVGAGLLLHVVGRVPLALLGAMAVIEGARGLWRVGPGARAVIERAATSANHPALGVGRRLPRQLLFAPITRPADGLGHHAEPGPSSTIDLRENVSP